MDTVIDIDIYETNIKNNVIEKFKENILAYIFDLDQKGIIEINKDFRTILMNKKCSMREFVTKYFEWNSIIDLEYICFKIDNINEKKTYIQEMIDIDEKFYNVNYVFIRKSPISLYFFAIIGKNDISKPDITNNFLSIDKNFTDIINKLLDIQNKINLNIDTIKKDFNNNISELSNTLLEHKTDTNDKIQSLQKSIQLNKDEHEKSLSSTNNELLSLRSDLIDFYTQSKNELLAKIKDNEKLINNNDVEMGNTINNLVDELNKKYEQKFLDVDNTLITLQSNFLLKYKSLEEDLTKKIETNTDTLLDKISEIQISLQELINIVLPNGKEFQRL